MGSVLLMTLLVLLARKPLAKIAVMAQFCLVILHPGSILLAQNWTSATDFPQEYVNSVIEKSGMLFAATDSAVYRSADDGLSWSLTPQQPPSRVLSTLAGAGGVVYLGTRGDGVFTTADSGASWQAVSTGLTGSARIIVGFAVRGDSLYAATDGQGVYVLRLSGPASWSAYNSGLFQYGCSTILTSGETLVAGIGVYLFVRTRDASAWSAVFFDSSFSNIPLSLLRYDTSLYLGSTHGVFRGDTGGTLWQKTDITQFPNRNIVALASHGPRVYAGLNYLADHWIFTSDDAGATWEIHSHEFANLLALTVASGNLWAGRVDGLWNFPLGPGTDVGEGAGGTPALYELAPNYPNPFNPRTTIRYDLPARSRVRLTVYTALGGEMARLVDGEEVAGAKAVAWDAAGVASGVYFYRLEASSVDAPWTRFSDTRKLVIVR